MAASAEERLQRLLRHHLSNTPQPPAPLLDADKALITSVRRCLFDFDAAAAELGLQPDECRLRWADLDQKACATLAISLGQSQRLSPDVAEVEAEASSFNVFTSRSLNDQMTELFAEARAALPSMNGGGSGSDDDDDDDDDDHEGANAVIATDVHVEDLEEEEAPPRPPEPQPQPPQQSLQRTPLETAPIPPRPTQPPPRARGRGAMFADAEEGAGGDESDEDEEAWHAQQRQAP